MHFLGNFICKISGLGYVMFIRNFYSATQLLVGQTIWFSQSEVVSLQSLIICENTIKTG